MNVIYYDQKIKDPKTKNPSSKKEVILEEKEDTNCKGFGSIYVVIAPIKQFVYVLFLDLVNLI